MKKVIILFVCVLVAFSSLSMTTTSRDIHLRARDADQEALRSILPVKAILDDKTIRIEFFDSPKNVVVNIVDINGINVITNIYSSTQLIQLQINKPSGSYEVEIIYDEMQLFGCFSIE